MKGTIRRIDWVLDSYFLKDMQKALDGTILRLRLTVDAKIDSLLSAYEVMRCR
jgi:hypothetical protein